MAEQEKLSSKEDASSEVEKASENNLKAETISEEPGKKAISLTTKTLLALTFLTIVLTGYIFAKGTLATTTPYTPTKSEEGIISQLYLTNEGVKEVRCATVVDFPAQQVWAVVTDYKHFPEIFESKLWNMTVNKTQDLPDDYHLLTGEITSKFGHWPLEVKIKHSATPEKYVASWNESNDTMRINRGSWTITPIGNDKSLIVYELACEMDNYPSFFLNTVLLAQTKPAIRAVKNRLQVVAK